MTVLHERAFAKVNLSLFLGAARDDGRHELVTVFEAIELADGLQIEVPSPTGTDEVICPGVDGPNLVTSALSHLRDAGWGAPPARIEIEKRIPVAAGLGGGSADAAALLRRAPHIAPLVPVAVREIAASLGSDVPSQLDPGPALGISAGDVVLTVPELAEHTLLVVPQSFGLSTAEVYREADRLSLARPGGELAALRTELESSLSAGGSRLAERLLVNDLEAATVSLAPEIAGALEAVREAGGEQALVCGSGPTVIGICWGEGSFERAAAAREQIVGRYQRAIVVRPVRRGAGASVTNP